ncbi:MAG: HAMP domain-containing protein [Deltaproteobacteria bacterium]|nr:HAMP domain-containing protein [Deltaproteobacteria bacterium]
MQRARFLHPHRPHRTRQLRWVVPMLVLLLGAALATLIVQYRLSDQAVGSEFFRAHKTISHTGQLLLRGLFVGAAVLMLAVVAIGVWAFRLTHRIVAPVHTLHRALDAIVGGDLGVRVELHPGDEFQEVGQSLNRLVEEFGATLARVHTLSDGIEAAAAAAAREADDASAERSLHQLASELGRTLDFFRLSPRRTIREDDTPAR